MGGMDKLRLQYLVREYQATRENKDYEEIYEILKDYSMYQMRKFSGKHNADSLADEADSIIHTALFDALHRYDPNKGTQFSTFYFFELRHKFYDRYIENINTLSASRSVKQTKLNDLSINYYMVKEEPPKDFFETDTYFQSEQIEDFMLFLNHEQRSTLKIYMEDLSISSDQKKEDKIYENRRRIKILYKYYQNLHEEISERVIYLIGIKRIIVDNVNLAKVTKEINNALDGLDYRRNEMSAALLYVFYHLQKRYPVLKNQEMENLLQVTPEKRTPINPIKLEIVKNIIRKEVEKCLTH